MNAMTPPKLIPPVPQHRGQRDVADRAHEGHDRHDGAHERTPQRRPDRVIHQKEALPELLGNPRRDGPRDQQAQDKVAQDRPPLHHEHVRDRGEAGRGKQPPPERAFSFDRHVHGGMAFHRSGDPLCGLIAGRVDEPRAHEQPEQGGEHHDHQRAADEFGGGELPAHQQRQDDAQLRHEVGRTDLERHRGGEVGALAEQRSRQGHRGIRARRRGRPQPGGHRQGARAVIAHQRHDRRAPHDGLHHRREGEADDQRPQNFPCHRTRERQGVPDRR